MNTQIIVYNAFTPNSNTQYEVYMDPNFSGIRWRMRSVSLNKIIDQCQGAFYGKDAVSNTMRACELHWNKLVEFGETYNLTSI